ncbi:MAG: iron-sulfur cluster assembly scaffold protein [Candidatus Korobacteraceae bacterium]
MTSIKLSPGRGADVGKPAEQAGRTYERPPAGDMGTEKQEDRDPRQTAAIEYLIRGFRRNHTPSLPVVGRAAHDGAGHTVLFSIDVRQGVLNAVSFSASSCPTLIAYSEYVAEHVIGTKLVDAMALTPKDVIASLKGIPPYKCDRARLAVTGLRLVVKAALNGEK